MKLQCAMAQYVMVPLMILDPPPQAEFSGSAYVKSTPYNH